MPFDFILAVIVLSFGYKLLEAWTRQKAGQRTAEEANSELVRRLGEVEERVRVLERIVTDERFDLRQQFRDLGG
jgi:hypothetical protein